MKPSAALARKRAAVREATTRFRTANPRVFGSVVHGTDQDGSDLDVLVDALPGATLFDLGGLQAELEDLLGVSVDLVTPADLPATFANGCWPRRSPYEPRTVCPSTLTTCGSPHRMRELSSME